MPSGSVTICPRMRLTLFLSNALENRLVSDPRLPTNDDVPRIHDIHNIHNIHNVYDIVVCGTESNDFIESRAVDWGFTDLPP